MITLYLILIIVASAGLGFIVLIQNPKGGGVKQTTDVLEKGTWIFAAAIAVLAMTSTLFLKSGGSNSDKGILNKVNTSITAPASTPAPVAAPANAPAAAPAADKK